MNITVVEKLGVVLMLASLGSFIQLSGVGNAVLFMIGAALFVIF